MAEPFLSEIRIMSFAFPPKGWALCDGQLLPINQNQALFSLLGTTFGGDGRVNFGLPDLQSRASIHVGSGHTLGERGGEQAHTCRSRRCPHTRILLMRTMLRPLDNQYARGRGRTANWATDLNFMGLQPTSGQWPPYAVTNTGGSQAHQNMQPFLVLSFCIALAGHLPVADLRKRSHGTALRRRNPHVRRQFRNRPAGCSARDNCCRSPNTKPFST